LDRDHQHAEKEARRASKIKPKAHLHSPSDDELAKPRHRGVSYAWKVRRRDAVGLGNRRCPTETGPKPEGQSC
jgi:hypothetical protein